MRAELASPSRMWAGLHRGSNGEQNVEKLPQEINDRHFTANVGNLSWVHDFILQKTYKKKDFCTTHKYILQLRLLTLYLICTDLLHSSN